MEMRPSYLRVSGSASPINLPDDLDWPFVKENGEWVNKE